MSLPPLKDGLIRAGLWADKGLGQHFLLDPEITRRIAAAAGPLDGRCVIEVGPGPGGLTRALLEAGADPVIAIERDRRFAPLLEPLIAWSGGRLRLEFGDALEADYKALLAAAGAQTAQICANLPYNVATPLLIRWLKAGAWRADMTLMFQKEVAERIVASAGSSAYGRLSVLAGSTVSGRIVLKLGPRAFTPPPKVASAVVRLSPLPTPFTDLDALETVTAAAFGQRRKMLRSGLSGLKESAAMLEEAGLDPAARAETIPPAGFQALAAAWRRRNPR